MNDRKFKEAQVNELRHLLTEITGSSLLRAQFEKRLRDAEDELSRMPAEDESEAPLLRTALFIRGENVKDSDGIRPGLASEVLAQYEKMFTGQVIHMQREAARTAGMARRPRSEKPALWFTGTPRGSFGLEFVPQTPEDSSLRELYSQAIRAVSDTVFKVASGEQEIAGGAPSDLPELVVRPLGQLIKALAQYKASVRIAVQGTMSRLIEEGSITQAAYQMSREVIYNTVIRNGSFQGVTTKTGIFDFESNDGELITGEVAAELVEDLPLLLVATGKPCVATFSEKTIRTRSGDSSPKYMLNEWRAISETETPPS